MWTEQDVYTRLKDVMDPELHVNIVDLGLIYRVTVVEREGVKKVHVLMTLTTPGCPLAGTIQRMIKDALYGLPQLNVDRDVDVEITFDPPWTMDAMSEEVRAELGF